MWPNMCKNVLINEPAPRFERVTPTQSPEPGVPSSGHTSGQHTANELVSVVYEELRTLAHYRMGAERADHTLQPTALVHEVYLRLAEGRTVHWKNRAQFFAAAAHAMRRILVEQARKRRRLKRGGDQERISLHQVAIATDAGSVDPIALDEALSRLTEYDRRMSEVVTLRHFAGLTIAETADVLEISPRTVRREWDCAKAWLYHQLSKEDRSDR